MTFATYIKLLNDILDMTRKEALRCHKTFKKLYKKTKDWKYESLSDSAYLQYRGILEERLIEEHDPTHGDYEFDKIYEKALAIRNRKRNK